MGRKVSGVQPEQRNGVTRRKGKPKESVVSEGSFRMFAVRDGMPRGTCVTAAAVRPSAGKLICPPM